MGRLGRCLLFLVVVASAASVTGCGFAKRPYGHDPLLRNGAGIWGNPEMTRTTDLSHFHEPVAPHPPKPKEADNGSQFTSRP